VIVADDDGVVCVRAPWPPGRWGGARREANEAAKRENSPPSCWA